jgi:curved DNA-binding protein CbpA
MSSDAFATLGLPRAAVLDETVLKAAYDALGRATHPDQPGGDAAASTAVNEAYRLLSEPESRLKHLVELEAPEAAAAWGTVPMDEGLMTVFLQLGPVLQRVEALAKRVEGAGSALAKALLAGEQMQRQEEVEDLMARLEALRSGLEAELPTLDEKRSRGEAEWVEQGKALRAKFAYLRKWQAQLREALLKLM